MTSTSKVPPPPRAPVRVGLVGAGPWATLVHAPMLAAGPETELTAVWARRAEAATKLAGGYGAAVCADYAELLDRCEAVTFAVPPAVQAEMASTAAERGKAVLLEKPIAASEPAARRLADAVATAGVASMVLLTSRFDQRVRAFLDDAAGFDSFGGLYESINGGLLDGPFAQSPWRHEGGVLLDMGPHALDLMTAALGPVATVEADTSRGWVRLSVRHESGALSDAALCGHAAGAEQRRFRLFGPEGTLDVDLSTVEPRLFDTVRAEFAATVTTGTPHPCDVHRGLYLQELLARAAR